MKVLVINTGSSSIKYQLFNMEKDEVLAQGLAEQIGEDNARIKHSIIKANGEEEKIVKEGSLPDHAAGLETIAQLLTDDKIGVIKDIKEVEACGHRIVHGGEAFTAPTLINDTVIAEIEKCIPLAPLHNPANLTGLKVAMEIFPHAPQVGVFDTAFHQTMPASSFRYAIPEKFYKENGVRRYGFHGTSHLYVSQTCAKLLDKPYNKLNAITVHIGNGASICAIKEGKAIDTSMGLTPLEGLMMGTRSGDLDPAIPYFLSKNLGLSADEVNTVLNKESGMKGITGMNDLREIEDAYMEGEEKATLAISMYTYRIRKYIGSYMAALDGDVDGIIFTAGVGENSDIIRGLVCDNLSKMGIELNKEKNATRSKEPREIQSDSSKIKVFVIPTNEELEIAMQTLEVLKK